jgi:hypothetical protein
MHTQSQLAIMTRIQLMMGKQWLLDCQSSTSGSRVVTQHIHGKELTI